MRAVRFGVIGSLVAGMLALGMVAAMADTGAGTGQTPLSAALGFTVNSNGTGNQLNYKADPNGANAGFSAHCHSFFKDRFGTTKQGFPEVNIAAACTDENGVTVFLHSQFVDKGEPGTNDWVCIQWSYTRPVATNYFIHDMGTILAGNIQILENSDGSITGQMLSS